MADRKDDLIKTGQQPPLRKALPPFEGLRAFDAIARLGGVRKAAKWLDRDHAVLSRHLRALEEWVGITLVERVPTGLILTEAGKDYHRSIAQALDMVAHATLDLLNQGIHHQLLIWSTPGFAQQWLSRRLASLERANQGVEIELKPSVSAPDFLSHEATADIRYWASYEDLDELPSHLRSQVIAQSPIIPVASPDYLESAPEIHKPEGRGIALTNPLLAEKHLTRGDLVWIGKDNPAFPARRGDYVLIARHDRWNEPSLRKFRQWLTNTIAKDTPQFKPGS